MKNKKTFYFNEKIEAEKIIKDGFPNNKIDYTKMYIVAKYYRQTYLLGRRRLEKKIIEFCKKQNPDFNIIIEAEQIKRWVTSAIKYKLREIEKIDISLKEIAFLKRVNNNKDRKILFITLVFSKALKMSNTRRSGRTFKKSKSHYIRYGNFQNIISLSQITNLTDIKLAKIYNKYRKNFIFYSAEKELLQLLYADSEPGDKLAVTNFDDLVEEYHNIFGINVTYCRQCGREVKMSGTNQKYCKTCSLRVKREKHATLMNKRRNN